MIVVLAVHGGIGWWRGKASREVNAELARLKVLGEPTSPAELNAFYRIEVGETDVTKSWVQIFDRLMEPQFVTDSKGIPGFKGRELPDSDKPPLPGGPWPELAKCESFVEKYRLVLNDLHKAAEANGATRYDVDFFAGIDGPLNHTNGMQRASQLVLLDAYLSANRGNSAEVTRSILTLLALGNTLQREPMMVSQLIRIAITGMGHALFRDMFSHLDFSRDELLAIQRVIRRDDFHAPLYRAMMGERVMNLLAFDQPPQMLRESDDWWKAKVGESRDADKKLLLEKMDGLIWAATREWPVALELAEAIESEIASLPAGVYPATKMLCSGLKTCFQATARRKATCSITDAAIAIELFRRENDRTPESLSELVPKYLAAIVVNPYSDEPIQYVVEDDHVAVFCAGGTARTDEPKGKYVAPEFEFIIPLGRDQWIK